MAVALRNSLQLWQPTQDLHEMKLTILTTEGRTGLRGRNREGCLWEVVDSYQERYLNV